MKEKEKDYEYVYFAGHRPLVKENMDASMSCTRIRKGADDYYRYDLRIVTRTGTESVKVLVSDRVEIGQPDSTPNIDAKIKEMLAKGWKCKPRPPANKIYWQGQWV